MVALFVALMFIGFILTDLILQRVEARRAARAAAPWATQGELASWVTVPEGVRLSRGHSWLMPLQEGTVRAGVDSLVAKAVGVVHRIQLPAVGEWVKAGRTLARLAFNGRALSIASPVSGRISAVNQSLCDHPELLANDPYGSGWICSIDHTQQHDHTMHSGQRAALWLERELDRFREFLSSLYLGETFYYISMQPAPDLAVGPTSQDAGLPTPGVLGHFGTDAWIAFEREFTQIH